MSYIRDDITYFDELAEYVESTPEHELVFFEVLEELTNQIYDLMQQQGMTKADLAKKLHLSRAAVTQALAGETNFTVKTIAKYITALNGEFNFKVTPKNEKGYWRCLTDKENVIFSHKKKSNFSFSSFRSVTEVIPANLRIGETDKTYAKAS